MGASGTGGDASYLEAVTKIIFMGGLNRQVVENKWPGFLDAFKGFDVGFVADMTPEDVERLASDDRVIKYKAKLAAVVTNAGAMQDLAQEHGSFKAYVDQLYDEGGADAAAASLAKDFSYVSEDGARNWLYATGYDVGEVCEKTREKYGPA
ncbi:MAG: DNA-3-methyladenine glycosylase I [Anaerolineae bacterium]